MGKQEKKESQQWIAEDQTGKRASPTQSAMDHEWANKTDRQSQQADQSESPLMDKTDNVHGQGA